MMLIHRKCHTYVQINLSKDVKFLVSFGLYRSHLKVGGGDLQLKSDVIENPQFYCPDCRKDVDTSEVQGVCSNCGDIFELDNLYRESGSGGIYCDGCKKGNGTRISVVASKLALS